MEVIKIVNVFNDRHRLGIGDEGTILHLLNRSHAAASSRTPANQEGLTVSQAASPLGKRDGSQVAGSSINL